MAIVEMKRIAMLALRKDQSALLRAMQRMGCVQVTPLSPEEAAQYARGEDAAAVRIDEALERIRFALGQLNRYDTEKKSMFGGKPGVSTEEMTEAALNRDERMAVVAEVEALERAAGDLRGQDAKARAQLAQLAPWAKLPVPVADIAPTKTALQWLGVMPATGLAEVQQKWETQPVWVSVVSEERDARCLWVIAHRSVADSFMADLKAAGFTQTTLSGFEGTVAQEIDALNAQLRQAADGQADIVLKLREQAKELPRLRVLHDALNAERERLAASARFAQTDSAFYLRGWVPAALADKVEKKLLTISPSATIDITTPEPDDEPPVLLHNNAAVTPFESVVTGFALPAPNGLDPTAVMMPFFVCFFGMMVSDAGYGLLMAILMPLIIRFGKPSKGAAKLMWILAAGGLATVLWGALYNTWFGFAPWPSIFDPINNSLPVMGLCIGLGAVHLFTGLGVAAYMNIKRGHPWSALFDQASWFMLVVGLGMLILPQTAQIGKIMAIAGAGLILVTTGREKSRNPFKRLISGLGALYGITSWVSDLLSYMRLFGMGLATGVIGMVINQLVGMVFSAGPIGVVIGSVLFVGAHLFNLGINVLGAYVHSCRLQYIEFFGKFYEEGGKPFKPLCDNPRFVDVLEPKEG